MHVLDRQTDTQPPQLVGHCMSHACCCLQVDAVTSRRELVDLWGGAYTYTFGIYTVGVLLLSLPCVYSLLSRHACVCGAVLCCLVGESDAVPQPLHHLCRHPGRHHRSAGPELAVDERARHAADHGRYRAAHHDGHPGAQWAEGRERGGEGRDGTSASSGHVCCHSRMPRPRVSGPVSVSPSCNL